MAMSMTLKEFLEKNRISNETWEASTCKWDELAAIGADHESHRGQLLQSAELFAKAIQNFDSVHSVRWRVKNTDHLLEKIVRKRCEESEKYLALTLDNYHQVITDLVGIRALHLFKDDCFAIDGMLRTKWPLTETPVAYTRLGDTEGLEKHFAEKGFNVKRHPAGYRSIHYVCESQAFHRKVFTEVQVRTIFEEGWSEIDHRIRYPNFSENALVGYFLAIFNRMAGSADEMGGFVRGLTTHLDGLDSQLVQATREKEQTLVAMEKLLGELGDAKIAGSQSQETVVALRAEIEKMRQPTPVGLFLSESAGGSASEGGAGNQLLRWMTELTSNFV